jgi:hypothetical protein
MTNRYRILTKLVEVHQKGGSVAVLEAVQLMTDEERELLTAEVTALQILMSELMEHPAVRQFLQQLNYREN